MNMQIFKITSIPEYERFVYIEGVIFGSDMGLLIPSGISFRVMKGLMGDYSDVITINSSNTMKDFLDWFEQNIEPFDKNVFKFQTIAI